MGRIVCEHFTPIDQECFECAGFRPATPKVTNTGAVAWGMKMAANGKAWALGEQRSNGFHVRRVVWGLLMARSERRKGEQIRAAKLMVEKEYKRR